jgi:hypothetical protein
LGSTTGIVVKKRFSAGNARDPPAVLRQPVPAGNARTRESLICQLMTGTRGGAPPSCNSSK